MCVDIGLPNKSVLVETVFGWIMTGDIPAKSSEVVRYNVVTVRSTIEEQLERFWKIEELLVSEYSFDEKECETQFQQIVSRDGSGRYIVQMPKQPDFKDFKDIDNFMQEYLDLGHMAVVPENKEDKIGAYYLPYHPVLKESSATTKLRVVFDCSAKTTTGKSLNDALLVGPVAQEELLTLVIRFRSYRVAIVADIVQMYWQVTMHPDDRHLQRILWRFDNSQPIRSYELCTVTYGLAPLAFLATRTLLQLAHDEGEQHSKASTAVKQNLYVWRTY